MIPDPYLSSPGTGFRVGTFVDHNCSEDITGDTMKPGTDNPFDPHAMSAASLVPVLMELVQADPKVKPKALVAQLGRYVIQTPTLLYAAKVKRFCQNMVSTTKAINAGSVLGYASLCRAAGHHAEVRVIDDVDMKKVYEDITVPYFFIR